MVPRMARRLFVAALALATVAVLAPPASAAPGATGSGAPTDRHIQYVGRWDTTDPTAYVPQWAGAYLRVGFTGSTVALDQRDAVDLWYSVDGGPYTGRTNVSGTVDLTPTPLARGRHSLLVSYRIVAGSYTGDAVYRGLTLAPGRGRSR
jgi:hypothetical protein